MMHSESDAINQKIESIRILHLSDFHFPDVKFEEGRSLDMERGFYSPQIAILNEVYDIIDDVDFIFISGDFTTSRNIDDFDKCLSFICEKFSHHRAKIFSVLGNHDLDRREGAKKFNRFLQKAQEYPVIDFGGPEICEQRKLTKSLKLELDLLLINTCKNSSDNPIIPENLEDCVKEPLLQFDDVELVKKIWDQIKNNIEDSTLIDDIYFMDDDYKTLTNKLAGLGSFICLSHYNLVPFSGIDKLNSFFSDQGKFRDIFVNHKNTVVYLSGHTHTQECTVIENPEDQTNKLVCITSPPFFKIHADMVNGFNVIDIIQRMDDGGSYKPIGCKIKHVDNNLMAGSVIKRKKIRFSKSFVGLALSDEEGQVLAAIKESAKQTGKVRLKDILARIDSYKYAHRKFSKREVHGILMYLWWIGVIDEYSAMNRENVSEAKLIDYVGGVLCVPIGH